MNSAKEKEEKIIRTFLLQGFGKSLKKVYLDALTIKLAKDGWIFESTDESYSEAIFSISSDSYLNFNRVERKISGLTTKTKMIALTGLRKRLENDGLVFDTYDDTTSKAIFMISDDRQQAKKKSLIVWTGLFITCVIAISVLFSSNSSVDEPLHKYNYAETTPEGSLERLFDKTVSWGGKNIVKVNEISLVPQLGGEYQGKNLLIIDYNAKVPVIKTEEEVLREVFKVLGTIGKNGKQYNIGEVFLKPQGALLDKFGNTKSGQLAKVVFPYSKAKLINVNAAYNYNAEQFRALFTDEGRNFKWLIKWDPK